MTFPQKTDQSVANCLRLKNERKKLGELRCTLATIRHLPRTTQLFGKLAIFTSRHQAGIRRLALIVVVSTVPGCSWISETDSTTERISGQTDEVTVSTEQDHSVLPLKARKRIWDIEHFAFVLEQKSFPSLKATLATGDRQKFLAYFSENFSAQIPHAKDDRSNSIGEVSFQSISLDRKNSVTVDRDGFVEQLFAFRSLVVEPSEQCSISIGNVRLHPESPNSLEGVWNAQWLVRLSNQGESRRAEVELILNVQIDQMSEDIPARRKWITHASIDKVNIRKSPALLMTDVTTESGIDSAGMHDNWQRTDSSPIHYNTGGVYVSDYNQDGRLDLLIDDVKTGLTLYRATTEGKFVDATSESGLNAANATPLQWTLSCWGDWDGDGDDDLISEDRLYENLGNGTFRDVTQSSNLLLTPASAYSIADYDLDGRLDIYVSHSQPYLPGQQAKEHTPWIDGGLGIDNVLWRNLGDWQFEDVTSATGAGGQGSSTFAAVWLHVNHDRYPDLLATNEFGRNSLLVSQGDGTFRDTTIDPVFGGFSMGATSADFDNDGLCDLYVANMYSKAGNRIMSNVDRKDYPPELYDRVVAATIGSRLYRNTGDGQFIPIEVPRVMSSSGWAYGTTFADFNGDGWQDAYATAGFLSLRRGDPDG